MCNKKSCPLFRAKEVPYSGNKKAKIVFIGESPGVKEVKEGEPFVKYAPGGKILRNNTKKAGLNWSAIFIMNSARCMIDKNTLSGKQITQILAHCRPKVEFALKTIKPKAIVVLGDFALRQILRKSGITKARGKWVWCKEFNCWILPAFHTAYIARNQALEPILLRDLKMVAEFEKNNYKVKTKEDSVDYREVDSVKNFIASGCTIGIDTESQGLDWLDRNFLVVSYSVSNCKGIAFQVVLYEECNEGKADFSILWDRLNKKKVEKVEVFVKRAKNFNQKLDDLQWIMENPQIKKYMANGNFDIHGMKSLFRRERNYNLQPKGYVMDVQAAAHLVDENVFKMARLDDLQKSFTDYKVDYKSMFTGKEDILATNRKDLSDYACGDADTTRRVGIALRIWLLQNKKLLRYFVNFLMPVLQNVLIELEENGAYIDRSALPKVKSEVVKDVKKLQKKAESYIPLKVKEIHLDKGLQLTRDRLIEDTLFSLDGFELEPIKKTKGKEHWSIDKEVRTALKGKKISKRARNFIETYDRFMELDMMRRFLGGFEKHIKADSRIHSKFSLVVAVTGRTASSNPNLQNQPKWSKEAIRVRRLISAPEGKILLAVDQEQAEMRWLAQLSGDKELIKAFKSGEDIHISTAKNLSRKDWNLLGDTEKEKLRQRAKSLNFGVNYLMSAKGFVKYSKIEYDIDITEKEAVEWIKIYFRRYNGIPAYHRRMIDFCRKYSYVESPLGRRRRLPEINSPDNFARGEAERQAVNHPIQSPSSDTVLLAGKEMLKENMLNRDEILMVLFVHDELIFEVKDNSKVVDYAKTIKYFMENPPLKKDFGIDMKVPLVAGVKVGRNLAQMTALEI